MKQLCFAILWFWSVVGFTQPEQINYIHSDIVVDTSGQIVVSETMNIYAAGNVFKRGITRGFPLKRKDTLGNSIPVSYNIKSVLKDGEKTPYFTKKENGELVLYVGEESVFLKDGEYTYTINYTVNGQIGFFLEYDELYWNVNGTNPNFSIPKLSATIELPKNAEPIKNACYTGVYGNTEANCTFEIISPNKVKFEALNAGPGGILTIATSLAKGIIYEPPPPPPPTYLQKNGAILLSFLVSAMLLFYYFFTWRKYGIDPPKPTVIPQFNPPSNLSAASIGMLNKGRYWNDLITTSIVSLGAKGYLKIIDKKKEYIFGLFKDQNYDIEKLKESDNTLPDEEKLILKKLFSKSNTKKIDGKYDSSVGSMVQEFQLSVVKEWRPLIYEGFNVKFWIFPILCIIGYSFLFAVLSSNYFTNNRGASFVAFFVINIIIFLLYQWLIRKPAERKLKLKSEIEGFKMYLSAAEEKQLQQFNPPKITPEIFEKFLPYAIALEVDDIWGKKFQSFLNSASLDKNYQPTWYNLPVNNFGGFTHTLNSSLSNTIIHSSTKPSNSSGGGSWSGGSGGGGFSGGGGGGGSVGGW